MIWDANFFYPRLNTLSFLYFSFLLAIVLTSIVELSASSLTIWCIPSRPIICICLNTYCFEIYRYILCPPPYVYSLFLRRRRRSDRDSRVVIANYTSSIIRQPWSRPLISRTFLRSFLCPSPFLFHCPCRNVSEPDVVGCLEPSLACH